MVKERDVYLDNIKSVLILFVVYGHFTDLNRNDSLIAGINNIIYSFHMPLFIFTSGFLSRNISGLRPVEINKILYSYVVFEALNFAFTKITHLGFGSLSLLHPTHQNWYLIGVFIWRLLIPYSQYFSKKATIIFCLAVTIVIGFTNELDNILSLHRIIYFAPFFILGYFCKDLKQLRLRLMKYKFLILTISIALFSTIFILSYSNAELNKNIALAYTPIRGYLEISLISITIRILAFSSSIILSLGVLILIPLTQNIFTKMGRQTLNIFLLHMFLVFPLNALYYELSLSSLEILGASFILSVGIIYLLAIKPIAMLMTPLTNFKVINKSMKLSK
jgi:fucose 4-O-acetylase-like acetyltransferase